MSYSIDFGKWNSVFVVPNCVVDEYLQSATEPQLKILLWMLRYAGTPVDIKIIMEKLGVSEKEVISVLDYWSKCGFINQYPKEDRLEDSKKTNEKLKTSRQVTSRYKKPDTNYMSERIQNSKDINFLIQEAQMIFGRTLSNGDISSLLMLHDNDGLPVDVILMLIQYAVSEGKTGMRYIEKMGMSWANEGIYDLEKAEEKISNLNLVNVLWRRFENIIGVSHRSPTTKEVETVVRWFNDWNFSDELVREAYERCVDANGKYILKYMDSIIVRWYKQGIFTIEQALSEKFYKRNRKSDNYSKSMPSYSIDDYENYNIFDKN